MNSNSNDTEDSATKEDISCPSCHSQKVIYRIWGLPIWDAVERLQEQYYQVATMGCCIDLLDPLNPFKCEECDYEWTHGEDVFNPNNPEDASKLDLLRKAKRKKQLFPSAN